MLEKLIRLFKIWRYERELKCKNPDPFIVCDHAVECNDLCNPLECDACTEPKGLYYDPINGRYAKNSR